MKSESTRRNGVLLCSVHHAWKTVHGREARPMLLAYLETWESDHPHVELVEGCDDCREIRARLA